MVNSKKIIKLLNSFIKIWILMMNNLLIVLQKNLLMFRKENNYDKYLSKNNNLIFHT